MMFSSYYITNSEDIILVNWVFVNMAWRDLVLQMEETASTYGV